jgi:thiamine-phosphate pyrophosphorylase
MRSGQMRRACETHGVAAGDPGTERRARLAAARLYLVCPPFGDESGSARGGARWSAPERSAEDALADLLRQAVAGGVDIVQLREKHLGEQELLELARSARELCRQVGALLIVNDHPLLAREAQADGIHVGQDDMPVAEVRELVGSEMLIGLSTHAPGEIDAAEGADYIGVGPVHETPTKPGRPAVGLELVRYAATHARVPFFAIGGLDSANLPAALDAGARRAVVLRAISDAEDPRAAARTLRTLLERRPLDEPR